MNFKDKKQKQDAYNHVGNAYQICGTRHYRLDGGSSDGCRCIDVRTGSGFEYTVVCDRGMDISLASYKGVNLVYLTENAESAPSFYDSRKNEWLKTFTGGLLTTCGPTNIGPSCTDNGEELGMHGRWSATPAAIVSDQSDYESGKSVIEGTMKNSYTMSHKLKMHRRITSEYGASSLKVKDIIKNEGGKPVPLNMLYHINFGYPFLDENTKIHVPSEKTEGYDDYSKERIENITHMKEPNGNNEEKNYYHTFGDKNENVCVTVNNEKLGFGFYVRFNPANLPYMTQWILDDIKDYVLAIEPANVLCESRDILRKLANVPMLSPGESMEFEIELGVLEP